MYYGIIKTSFKPKSEPPYAAGAAQEMAKRQKIK